MIYVLSGGTTSKKLPEFTYDGTYALIDDGEGNWRIKFLSSGKLKLTKLNSARNGIDVFCVGGGGGGGRYGGGGAGGFTNTERGIVPTENTEYEIVVGAGGTPASDTKYQSNAGGETSAFGIKASGGGGGWGSEASGNPKGGGYGGSGGEKNGGNTGGGGDGSDAGGRGQRNYPGPNGETGTTRAFGEESGDLYSGGGSGWTGSGVGGNGGGGSSTYVNGVENSGGGGAGAYPGGTGGSGIVIIRNRRS